ncbi:hypothetical protein CALCODRAFT_515000 [Calocera cornea HHB12733]|uniref:Uncharacterized protein n=1 Tax=Calocera cornea HHB12733 TaxID=1353952 RepID=A0A165IX19_9BASI|nr:hypothetical protein CALCODRAFT_515000 [Calocera cornea HHB12733]
MANSYLGVPHHVESGDSIGLSAVSPMARSSLNTIYMIGQQLYRSPPLADAMRDIDEIQELEGQIAAIKEYSALSEGHIITKIHFTREQIDECERSTASWHAFSHDLLQGFALEHPGPTTLTFVIDQELAHAADQMNDLLSKVARVQHYTPIPGRLMIMRSTHSLSCAGLPPTKLDKILMLRRLLITREAKKVELERARKDSDIQLMIFTAKHVPRRTSTSRSQMGPNADDTPSESAISSGDMSRVHTSTSDAGSKTHNNAKADPLRHLTLLPPPTTPQSSRLARAGNTTTETGEGANSDDMQVDNDHDAESAITESDTSRVRATETVRPPASVISSLPPDIVVDRKTGKVTRTDRQRGGPRKSYPMDPPSPREDIDLAEADWNDDPLHDDELLQAQARANARGIGETAPAYQWPVEPYIINWGAYLNNPDRIMEKFPKTPAVPATTYAQSWTWAKDRLTALNAPRIIKDCYKDKLHMHGQAVHSWQAKGAVGRRNLYAKLYLPALYDHSEFGDRVIGALVQATFVAKIDNGPDRLPDVEVFFSRLLQNNTGMMRIANQMAIAFKRGIADIAHENFTNYKQLEEINQQRKAQGKTILENLTEPPIIPMRELLSKGDLQAARDASVVPPDIATRLGVKADQPLNDPALYAQAADTGTTIKDAGAAHDHDHDHEDVQVTLPSPTTPVTRLFAAHPPEVAPFDVGPHLRQPLLDYFETWGLHSDTRQTFANRVAAMYWCCSPASWRKHLAELVPSNASAPAIIDSIYFGMECQHLADWTDGLC